MRYLSKTTEHKAEYWVTMVNTDTLLAHAGYGYGATLEEAQSDALHQARQIDPNAYLTDRGQVWFCGGVYC